MRALVGVLLVLGLGWTLAVGCTPTPAVSATPTSPAPGSANTPHLPPTATPVPAEPAQTGDADVRFEDPIAGEIYRLARAKLAEKLGISPDEIGLATWASVTWPDSSLGCPKEDQDYQPVQIPGYRLVLEAAGESYHYHADFQSVVYCDAADEVLPE